MNNSDRAQFAVMVAGVMETYGKAVSDAALEVWWNVLKRFELSDIELAMHRHINDPEAGRFPPAPAHLMRYLAPVRNSIIAWQEVEDAMFKWGAYRSVRFEDPTINAVLRDMGGWAKVCRDNREEPWAQKDFERRWDSYHASGIGYGEALPGLHEINNREAGRLEWIDRPVYIATTETKRLEAMHGLALPEEVTS